VSEAYYHQDALGSVSDLSNSAGNAATTYQVDPFGKVTTLGDASFNRHIYTGQEFDDGTDQHYFGARFYEPSVGRFVTQDPFRGDLGAPASLNRYLFVYNNPLKFVDLNGNFGILKKWSDYFQQTDQSIRQDFVNSDSFLGSAGLLVAGIGAKVVGGLASGANAASDAGFAAAAEAGGVGSLAQDTEYGAEAAATVTGIDDGVRSKAREYETASKNGLLAVQVYKDLVEPAVNKAEQVAKGDPGTTPTGLTLSSGGIEWSGS
jgi:RHS repeat-associated protein